MLTYTTECFEIVDHHTCTNQPNEDMCQKDAMLRQEDGEGYKFIRGNCNV